MKPLLSEAQQILASIKQDKEIEIDDFQSKLTNFLQQPHNITNSELEEIKQIFIKIEFELDSRKQELSALLEKTTKTQKAINNYNKYIK